MRIKFWYWLTVPFRIPVWWIKWNMEYDRELAEQERKRREWIDEKMRQEEEGR